MGSANLEALIALIAGIWILVAPRALNYIVAIYLILVGALGLLGTLRTHSLSVQTVAALAGGILILVRPHLLNYVVAIYLIVIGVLGLLRW
jgi:hypothetical protein